MLPDPVDAWLGSVYGGRRWLVGTEVAQAVGRHAAKLRGWGCPKVLGIGARVGTGALPDPADVELHVLGLPPAPMMEAILGAEDALRELPPEVQAAVDAWDPEGAACALGAFFSDGRDIARRRFFGARPRAWRLLEDKVVVDAVWDAAGVPRAPAIVVDVPDAAGRWRAIGPRTVWAGDAVRGFHGGGTYTCHVADDADAAIATARLAGRCDRARIMPWLDGIPCSAHGIVFPDGAVAVFRPAEMVVLRAPATRFVYCRGGTWWDPAPADREALRDVVRRVGRHLHAAYGYRGAFTVDGVMTADGFRPTELNPRVGAALSMMGTLPFQFLSDALVEGLVPPFDAAWLEARVVAEADLARVGSLGVTFDTPVADAKRGLDWDGAGWRATDREDADAVLTLGPGPVGGFANLTLRRSEPGRSLGPRAAALCAWLDAEVGAGIGPVTPASPAR